MRVDVGHAAQVDAGVQRVDRGDELELGVGLDGLAHRAAHAARRAEDAHLGHGVALREAAAEAPGRPGGGGGGGAGRRGGAGPAGRRGGGGRLGSRRHRRSRGRGRFRSAPAGAEAAGGGHRRGGRWRRGLLLGTELAELGLVGGQLAEQAGDVGVGVVEAALVLGVGPGAELAQQPVGLALGLLLVDAAPGRPWWPR